MATNQNPPAVFEAVKARPGLFAVMALSSTKHLDIFRKIHIYLVNNTDTAYPKIKRLTGAFSSMDDDLMETGKRMTDMAALAAHSFAEVEGSDTGELNFVVWYSLDMTDENGTYVQYGFTLPKPYHWEKYDQLQLPGCDTVLILPLSQRTGDTIEDYVRDKGLAPKYFENRDGKMIQRE